MARSEEEIQADIDEAQVELDGLAKLPPYFQMHGQVVDNRERMRPKSLGAELAGRSHFEGPDLEV